MDPESAIGERWASVVHPEDLDRVVDRMVPQPGRGPAVQLGVPLRASGRLGRLDLVPGGGAARRGRRGHRLSWERARTRSSARPWTARSRRPRSASPTPSRRPRSAWRWSGSTARSCASTAHCCEIVGYDADELLVLTFQDITHPDDLEADLELVREVIAGRAAQLPHGEALHPRRRRAVLGAAVGLARAQRRRRAALLRVADRGHDRAPPLGGRAARGRGPLPLRLRRGADRHGDELGRRALPARQPGAVRDHRLLARAARGDDLPLDHPPRRPGPQRAGLPGDPGGRAPATTAPRSATSTPTVTSCRWTSAPRWSATATASRSTC